MRLFCIRNVFLKSLIPFPVILVHDDLCKTAYKSTKISISFSAEDSSLRVFSTITDLLNKSLGVASYNRKLSKKHKQIDNSVKMEPIIGEKMFSFIDSYYN